MRTRRSKGQASEPLVEPKDYTWCLLCTGERKAGFYTNGALRQHYAKKHNLEDVPRTVHDVLTSLLHEVEMRAGEEEEPRDASSDAVPGSSHEVEMRTADRLDPDETDFFSAKMGRVRCDQCEHEAASPELLQQHVDIVHDLILHLMCDHCEFVTGYPADLEAHVKRVHSDEGPHDTRSEAAWPSPGSSHEVEMGNPSSHNNGSSPSIGGGGDGNGTTSASERSSHDDRYLKDSSDGEREGTIGVGKDYQASIPHFIESSNEVERRTAVRWEQCENELTCPELRQKHVHVVHDLIQDPVPGSSHEVEVRTAVVDKSIENTEEQEEEEQNGIIINRGIPDPQYNALGEEMEVYRGVPEHQYNAWPGRCGRLKYLCYGCFVWFNDKFSIDRHFYLRHLCDEQRWPEDFPPLVRYN